MKKPHKFKKIRRRNRHRKLCIGNVITISSSKRGIFMGMRNRMAVVKIDNGDNGSEILVPMKNIQKVFGEHSEQEEEDAINTGQTDQRS